MARRRRRALTPSLSPALEGLESRLVMSTLSPPVAVPPAQVGALQNNVSIPLSITSINLTSITASPTQAGVFNLAGQVTGTIAGQQFTSPLTGTLTQPTDGSCPILNLEIPQGLHLNLLGLKVDTSPICLRVTGESGQLLGDLLCGLTGALNPATQNLTGALSGLNSILGNTQLLNPLNSALSNSLSQAASPGTGLAPGACRIISLSLGPINLNVLGLDVELDNCAPPASGQDVGGPVTVDVTAQRGPGNLLGNLLCGQTRPRRFNFNLADLSSLLDQVTNIFQDGQASRRELRDLGNLYRRLAR